MSETGKNWLINAIDPFHDTFVPKDGFPDAETQNSVVQTFHLSSTISVPSFIPANTNWDLWIFDCPVERFQSLYNIFTTNGYADLGAPTTFSTRSNLGALLIVAVPPGFSPWINPNGLGVSFLAPPNDIYTDKLRVISKGFEVHNTTAELYKQGSVIVFEAPGVEWEDAYTGQIANFTNISGANYYSNVTEVVPVLIPPNSASQAINMRGAKQWEAKDGCYVVANMRTTNNPGKFTDAQTPVMFTENYFSSFPLNTTDTAFYPDATGQFILGTPTNVFGFLSNYISPFNFKGACFTGLSYQSTLTINRNITVERFPGSQSPFLTLARPACELDMMALEAYNQLMLKAPVGVPVCENAFGDWFTGAAASIIDAVTGTGFASSLDQWQKEKWSDAPSTGSTPSPQNNNNNNNQLKKQKNPGKKGGAVQGPRLPSGAFKSPQAKAKAKKKRTKAKAKAKAT
jgi:hypothetical protein